jgi:uncharacterized membrane protein
MRSLSPTQLHHGRHNGIDATRGLAVLAMILFHFSWDWNFLITPLSRLPGWYWETVPDIIGGTFFLVAGMSQVLSPKDPLREGAKIFGCGLLLTAVSLTYSPSGPIVFGVLHSLGLSKIVSRRLTNPRAYPQGERRRPPVLIILGMAFAAIGFGFWLRNLNFHSTWSYVFMWIGFRPDPIPTMADYYPLLPDIGYLWLGIVLARVLYGESPKNRPRPNRKATAPGRTPPTPILWVGRHALVIYLIHQPILFGVAVLIHRYYK